MSKENVTSKVNADGKIALVSILVGIYWAFEGFRLGVWDRISPGPGFFPVFVGALTIFFSILLLKQSKVKEATKMTDAEMKWLIKVPLTALVIVFAMNYIGTIVALTAFFVFWFKQIEKFSWKKAITLTLSIMIVLYLVFVQWLQVPFPKFFGLF